MLIIWLRGFAGKCLTFNINITQKLCLFKSINSPAPEYLSNLFTNRDSVTFYSLRDTDSKLAIPQLNTNYLKNSVACKDAVVWNSLPVELQQADTVQL